MRSRQRGEEQLSATQNERRHNTWARQWWGEGRAPIAYLCVLPGTVRLGDCQIGCLPGLAPLLPREDATASGPSTCSAAMRIYILAGTVPRALRTILNVCTGRRRYAWRRPALLVLDDTLSRGVASTAGSANQGLAGKAAGRVANMMWRCDEWCCWGSPQGRPSKCH